MNLGDIRIYINTVLNKHESGNSLSPDELESLLKTENLNFFSQQIKLGKIQDALRSFIVVPTSIIMTTGVGALPANFNQSIEDYCYYLSDATKIPIDIVPAGQFMERIGNALREPTVSFPIAIIRGSSIEVAPVSITPVYLGYLKNPTDPVFDYYQDSNRNVIYMPPSTTVDLDVINGIYSDGSTSGTQTSTSVELEYSIEVLPDFIEFVLSKLGVRSDNATIIQASENEKQIDRSL